MNFPALDPIPLPAPVWLFKVLNVLTAGLHFISVDMLLGGLMCVIWLNLFGHLTNSPVRIAASGVLAKRVPVVMTFVINLGIPPLLFTQVLYGRALYTSSVLIGVWWLGVVGLLMVCYWFIYKTTARVESGKAAWGTCLISLIAAACVAKIYTTNMTLMLRPEVWAEMYKGSALGTGLPPRDPTIMPRWLFMMAGGFVVTGVWMIWLAGKEFIEMELRRYLAGFGGIVTAVMVVGQGAAAWWAVKAQPAGVVEGLAKNVVFATGGWVWVGAAVVLVLLGLWVGVGKVTTGVAGWVGLVTGLVGMLGLATYRDGIRDYTLLGKGFDVWDRTVVTNWSVVGLFLGLFVVGLVVMGWLISVVMRAKVETEKVSS